MGRRHKQGRPINGVLLLNKHSGVSSNFVLQGVKRLFDANKAGHTGALDPLATGMLPICFGEATKFSHFLLDADKTYQVTAQLGKRTTTSDADGEVIAECPVNVSEAELLAALADFEGTTDQIPSIYSALKYRGKPYYFYARQGIEIPRKSRKITLYTIQLNHFGDDKLALTVRCSKGTYIRTLIDDLGQRLGCGAHVTALHRTQVANYPEQQMLSFQELQARIAACCDQAAMLATLEQHLLPVDSAISGFPVLQLKPADVADLIHGRVVTLAEPVEATGLFRAYAESSACFLGLVAVNDNRQVQVKRLIATSDYLQRGTACAAISTC